MANIREAADNICGIVKQNGSNTEYDVKGKGGIDANVTLGAFSKDLIGKLIEGNVSIGCMVERRLSRSCSRPACKCDKQ
jgi:hypothetical protein